MRKVYKRVPNSLTNSGYSSRDKKGRLVEGLCLFVESLSVSLSHICFFKIDEDSVKVKQ